MARKKKKDSYIVSLFPFLSILACVIGVLTLLITAMALGQLDPEAVRAAQIRMQSTETRVEQYEKLVDGIESTREEVERLRRMVADAMRIKADLVAARAELKRLESEQVRMVSNDQGAVDLLAKSNELRRTVTELQADLANVNQLIEQLKLKLKRRLEAPEEAVVRIQPGGSGFDLVPTFIECTATNLIVYHNNTQTRIRRSDLSRSDKFGRFLDAIAAHPKGIAVFLIREDGLRTYYVARSIAKTRYCRNGKLPVIGQGKLDLTVFDELVAQQRFPDDLPGGDEPGDETPETPDEPATP